MTQEQDVAAIRQIAVDCDAAWRRQDSFAFARQFAEDADFTSIGGQRCHGRSEIAAAHANLFKTVFHDTRTDSEILDIRFLRPDVAVVELQSSVHRKSDGQSLSSSLPQWIVTREGAAWSIAIFRNMVPIER